MHIRKDELNQQYIDEEKGGTGCVVLNVLIKTDIDEVCSTKKKHSLYSINT